MLDGVGDPEGEEEEKENVSELSRLEDIGQPPREKTLARGFWLPQSLPQSAPAPGKGLGIRGRGC